MAGAVRWDLFANPRGWNRGFDQAEARSRRFQQHLRTTERSTARFSASLGSVGGVAVRAFGGATVALGGLAAAGAVLGLKTAANLETAEVGFTRLLGSAKRARGFLGDLKRFAARTPFELPGLVDAARALVGAGTAAKNVIPIMSALGDASGALGLDQERFGRVMLAVTQIMNKGKVSSEELLQITEAGLPVWPLLAKATGKTVPELQKLTSEGKLLAADVLPKLFDQMRKDYGGGMVAQSKTLSGIWSTFKDTIALTLSDALEPLLPMLKTALPKAAEAFQGAVEGIVSFFRDDLIPALKDAQEWWKDNADIIKTLGDTLNTIFVPAAEDAKTSTDDMATSAENLQDTLDGVLEAGLRAAQGFNFVAQVAGIVAMGFWDLVVAGGHVINVVDKLSGGTGHAADAMVDFARDMRDKTSASLDRLAQDARDTQKAIDKLHGKNINITGALKLSFSPSFTQKDWVAVRLAAGRMAAGGPVGGPGPRGKDNQLRWLAPDEHVWTGREVVAAGGHAAMEAWRKATLRGEIPELAGGGPVGRIDAQTRNVNRLQAWGTGRRMDAGITKLLSSFSVQPPHVPGGWQVAVNMLRRLGMVFDVISTFRPGARTRASGSVSYHALNRAVDLAGPNMLAIFEALTRTNPTELIYSGASRYKSRRGWRPIGALDPITLADHWSHVHAAYDRGGWLPTGTSLATNRTGRPERVLGAREQVIDRAAARMIAEELAKVIPTTIRVDDMHTGLLSMKRGRGRIKLGLD